LSAFGTRQRPIVEGVYTEGAQAPSKPFECERTGWTPDHALPRWIADLGWLIGLAARKAWLYVCAPMGLIFWIVALLTSL
jgi:hypothetical protein